MLGQLKDYFVNHGVDAYFDAPGILEISNKEESIQIWEHEENIDENYIYTNTSKKFRNWFEVFSFVKEKLEL